ncbi:hypothetical protein C8Q77DRAFT_543146 [Trametes polyzona]|nr:hypothetical protein C8Q77DRAFT_543146 [Trametes polyzona]
MTRALRVVLVAIETRRVVGCLCVLCSAFCARRSRPPQAALGRTAGSSLYVLSLSPADTLLSHVSYAAGLDGLLHACDTHGDIQWLIARVHSTAVTPAAPTAYAYNGPTVRAPPPSPSPFATPCRCAGADSPSFVRPVSRCISCFLFFYTRCAVVALFFAKQQQV